MSSFSWNILLLCLMFVCATSATEKKISSYMDMNSIFMKVNEKVDFLSDRLDKLEESSSTGSNAIESSIQQLMKNTDKISKIEELLLKLIETVNNQKMIASVPKKDVFSELSSQCTSICESKVDFWANETRTQIKTSLNNLGFAINSPTFESDPNTNKFYSSNSCDPNPCFGGGHCAMRSYCTECPFLTSGSHCQDLNCNKANNCFQYQNKLYVYFEESGSWEQAYNRCLSEGMRLAMPKDMDTTEFVVKQLRSVYGDSARYFWIGLKNNGTAEYRWIDGTSLGHYVGGMGHFKSLTGERWGLIWLDGKSVYWHPRSLSEINSNFGSLHNTLCEKPIFIRF